MCVLREREREAAEGGGRPKLWSWLLTSVDNGRHSAMRRQDGENQRHAASGQNVCDGFRVREQQPQRLQSLQRDVRSLQHAAVHTRVSA